MNEKKSEPVEILGQACPVCSARVITDGKWVWCSSLGGRFESGCEFGHDRDVSLDEFLNTEKVPSEN